MLSVLPRHDWQFHFKTLDDGQLEAWAESPDEWKHSPDGKVCTPKFVAKPHIEAVIAVLKTIYAFEIHQEFQRLS